MGEGLGEIAEALAAGTGFLSVQSQVVGVSQHLLEHEAGLVEPPRIAPAGAGEGLDEPESAHVERALVSAQPVGELLVVVAIDEAVGHQPALLRAAVDGVDGAQHARVGGRHEEDQRHDEVGGVQRIAAVMLDESLALLVPAAALDLLVNFVAGGDPALALGGERAQFRKFQRAIKHDPTHQLGVDELLPAAAGLPDALVGQAPVVADPVGHLAELGPEVEGYGFAVPVEQVNGVHELAVDVQLELVVGAISHAYGL